MTKSKKSSTTTTPQQFRRQFDKTYTGDLDGEVNNMPSMTQPDMSLSVIQLLKNHTTGTFSDVSQNKGVYSNTEIPRFDDITDKVKYVEDLREQSRQLELTVKKEIKDLEIARLEQIEKDKEQNEEGTPHNPPTPPEKE